MIDIEKLTREKYHLVDGEMKAVLGGKIPNLHDAIEYHMETGGKRLRSILAITMYEALGGKGNRILPFAAACEMFHNWCLPRDAKILTNPGKPKSITELKIGDMVYTFDTEKKTASKNRVLNIMETGMADIYEIRTPNRRLSATAGHPVLTCSRKARVFMDVDNTELNADFRKSGYSIRKLGIQANKTSKSRRYEYTLLWKRVDQLKKGDMLVISTNLPDEGKPHAILKTGKFKLTKNGVAALSQLKPFRKRDLLAFGTPYKKVHAVMSGKRPAELETLKKIFESYKLSLKEDYYIFSGIIKDLKYPANTTEDFCQVIGFFLGDGFVSNNTIYFSQPKGCIRDYYVNLFNKVFGRAMTENISNECQLACHSRPLAELFRNLDLCHDAIKKRVPDWVFGLPRSQKLAFLRGYLDSDGTINKQGIARFACGSKILIEGMKTLLDSMGFITGNVGSFRVKNNFQKGSKKESVIWYVQISGAKKILNEIGTEDARYARRLGMVKRGQKKLLYGIPQNVLDEKFFGFSPVVSVKLRGEETVYNIEVENTHNFIANNVVVHNCLVHDDIEDGDLVRRDKPALWIKYGLAHGVNVGDYMEHKVFELILRSKKYGIDDATTLKLVDAMVTTSLRTSEGQAIDINMRSTNPTEKDYMDMVMGKTGHYLTVPMVGAAILAMREELIPHLVEFGRHIGMAFQITDDVLDLTEGKGRGEIGRDIKEGKKSILVIHCLGKCTPEERNIITGILDKHPEETMDNDVADVVDLLQKYGSVDYAKNRAEELKKTAQATIKKLPPELHEILEFFADYLVKRKK